jgi:hypothetical protein
MVPHPYTFSSWTAASFTRSRSIKRERRLALQDMLVSFMKKLRTIGHRENGGTKGNETRQRQRNTGDKGFV